MKKLNLFRRLVKYPVLGTVLAVWLILPVLPAVSAQPRAGTAAEAAETALPATVGLDLRELKARRSAVESSAELSEATRKSVLGNLDQAIRFQEAAAQLDRDFEETSQSVKNGPARIKAIREELERPAGPTADIASMAAKMTPEQLEQRIREEEIKLVDAQAAYRGWSDRLGRAKERPARIHEELPKAKQRLDEVNAELKKTAAVEAADVVVETGRLALLAEQNKLKAEINFLEQQLVTSDTLLALLTAENDLAAREVGRREAATKAWLDLGQQRRQAYASQAREETAAAQLQAGSLPQPVQEQFEVNVKLGEKLEALSRDEADLTRKLADKQAQLKDLEDDFSLARARVEAGVLTEEIGLALIEQRQSLPALHSFPHDSSERQRIMSEIRETQFDLERRHRALTDLEAESAEIVRSLGQLSKAEAARLKAILVSRLTDRRDLLAKLREGLRRNFKALQDIEFIERQIVDRTGEYVRFLDQHLLWSRGSKIIGGQDLQALPKVFGWLLGPDNRHEAIRDLHRALGRSPLLWTLAFLLTGLMLAGRRGAGRSLGRSARSVSHVDDDSYWLTMHALATTLWLTATWPFVAAFVGWQLLDLPMAGEFTRAMGSGLLGTVYPLAVYGFLLQVSRRNGLAQIHFKWPETALSSLRRNLTWLIALLVPLHFLAVTTVAAPAVESADALGRLAFIMALLSISVFATRIFRFSGAIMSTPALRDTGRWYVRWRLAIYAVAAGAPFMLAVLSATGYGYAAVVLWHHLRQTLVFLIILVLVDNLAKRWLYIVRRRRTRNEHWLQMEATRQAAAGPRATGESPPPREPARATVGEATLDMARIDAQTVTMLRTILFFSFLIGLWAIWSGVLPALRIIGDISLWSYQAVVDGAPRNLPITVANLVGSGFILGLTIAAARNLPGVLELILLDRRPVDLGTRYAFKTLSRYIIVAMGVVVAFATIGVRWANLQWLVAALGVGLGFGLQEIVANFFCGLIVLFEQPYRVGDIVTIGETSGTVTRIRIRATTIRDWDQRELIVPNKEFITGKLINWSLSDPITRITVAVGIAYGSDTSLAEKLLLEIARGNALVLDQPEPAALFVGFGDNSLNFELRVFTDDVNLMFQIKHELHQAINAGFREAGLSIAYPQRDVHVDTTRPLEVRVVGAGDR